MRPIVAGRLWPRTIGPMPQPDRNPLAATRRLLVDGTNLLHALSQDVDGRAARRRSSAGCVARSRPPRRIELVFDGPPERGLRNERIAAGVMVRYSGGRTADAVILAMIDDVRLARRRRRHGGPPGRDRRPRPAPRGATPRRTDGRLRVAARAARCRSARVAVDRQSTTGASRGHATWSRAVVVAGPVERRRPGRDGPSRMEDRTRRHDQAGQPQKAPKAGGTGRMRP